MDQVEVFNQYRPLLFAIAYRMLGSAMDAEDMVQETFLRWQQRPEVKIKAPKAYLTTIITRLCLDYLSLARVQREAYVGQWLPEPLLSEPALDVADEVALVDSLSMAFLVLLENLSPAERAVYLLHEIFDYDYTEIAQIVGKREDNCRQMVHRARQHITARRPRYDSSPEQQERLTVEFIQLCSTGDMQGLMALLSEDIVLRSDGGGKVQAALQPIRGLKQVATLLVSIFRKAPVGVSLKLARINGQPGFLSYLDNQPYAVVTLDIRENQIQGIYAVVNPEKLQGLPLP
jgi:RNA polymerase sigma-70 factor (ECF subfamily)